MPEERQRRAAAPTAGQRRAVAAWGAALVLAVGLPLGLVALAQTGPSAGSSAAAAPAPKVPAAPAQAPRRIVSLNPCLDAILLHVAEPGQIAALSHYARDPASSTVAHLAEGFPYTYATAEEVLMLKPDLVLTSVHSAPATRSALARMNIPVAGFGVPATVDESLAQVREVARRVGHPQRGEALVRRIEAALEAIRPASASNSAPVSALILQRDGFSPGEGTLQDDLLTRAGLHNEAARYGVAFWGVVPLERLVADPPRLLLAGRPPEGNPAAGDRLLGHPVLKRLEGRTVRAEYPPQLLYCGGPSLIEAARYLGQARQAVESAS